MKQKRKIGILTGGGDCPGLNAVIRAVAKSLIREENFEVYGFKDGFKGLVENNYFLLDEKNVSGILQRGGTILGTSNRDNPFQFCVVENGEKVYKDVSGTVIENANKLGLEGIVVIGGDGSLSIAKELADKGLRIIGVPKTIDNDLSATDVTFGFNTALATAVDSIDKLHTTAESHHRAMIVEVMGRYAGWIAIQAGLAGGADIILIPEIPYDIDKVCEKIIDRKNKGKDFSIIVAAEGTSPIGGAMTVKEKAEGNTDPIRLGGIGEKLRHEIEERINIEARATVLGHLQRGGGPNAYDRLLSTRYGVAAAELVIKKDYGKMVSLRGTEIISVLIEDAIKRLKKVDVDGELVRVAKRIGISFGN